MQRIVTPPAGWDTSTVGRGNAGQHVKENMGDNDALALIWAWDGHQ